MSNLATKGALLLLLFSTLPACTSIPPQPGFDLVQTTVRERTGYRIHWQSEQKGNADDQAIVTQVRAFLRNELTADSAVQVALLTNPRLQSTYQELGLAQAMVVQAGLLRNPVLGATVRYPRSGGQSNLDVDLEQDFLYILTLSMRKKLAKNAFKAARLRVTGEVLDLATKVRSAFYRAQADTQLIEMMQQVVSSTGASLNAARKLHNAGNITQLSLDRKRVLHEESRLMLADAENTLLADREALNVLMGLWGTATQWHFSQRLPRLPSEPFNANNVEQRAIERSLDLAIARYRMEGIARQLGLAKVQSVIPGLELGYAWERDDGEWDDGPRLVLPIPLFDMGQARRAGLRAQLHQAQRDYVALAIEIRSAARMAAVHLRQTRARLEHLIDVLLPLRQRAVYGAQLEYNAMQIGVFGLLTEQRRQVGTGRQFIETLRDYWLAKTGLDHLLNGRMMPSGGSGLAMSASMGMANEEGGH